MREPMYIVQGTDGKWSPPITSAELQEYVRRGYIKPQTRICGEAVTQDYAAGENPLLSAQFRELGIQAGPVHRKATPAPPASPKMGTPQATESPESKSPKLATFGFRLLMCGAVLAAYFLLFFNTTGAVNPASPQAVWADRVRIVVLVQERTFGISCGFAVSMIGAFLIGAGSLKGEEIDWRKITFGIFATKAPRWSVWAVAVLVVASVAFISCLSVAPGGTNAPKIVDAPALIGSTASAIDSKLGVTGVSHGANERVYNVNGVGEITTRFDDGVCRQIDIKLAAPAHNAPEALTEAGLVMPESKPYSSMDNGHIRHIWWQATVNGINYQRIGASGTGAGFDTVGITLEANRNVQ